MLTSGSILQNRYQIIRQLGAGGMGAVYQAHDWRLSRVVAVKENVGGDANQFQQEAALLANLSHPNLPRVSDHFVEPSGAQYLVMDYIEGEDLESGLARQGAFPETQVLGWFDQILDAVAYLHSRGVIHRDIKPGNIKITPQGKALLVDFGIAKVLQPGQMTATGARAATLGFAAPEQYRGGTDQRSDIYSLGAVLYALLTARVPPNALARAGGSAMLVPPHSLNPAVSTPVEQVILHALAVLPNQRFQSADEMRHALRSVRVSSTIALPRARQSAWMVWAVIGVAVILILLGIGVLWWSNRSSSVVLVAGTLTPLPTRAILSTLTLTASPRPLTMTPLSTATVSPLPTATVSPRPPTRAPTRSDSAGQIAFVSNRDGNNEIYLGNVDGSRLQRLTNNPASDMAPTWSPDGQQIVVQSNRDGNYEIYVMNTDGSNPRRLTDNPAFDGSPAWSPDGRFIAFQSSRDGNSEIYVVKADGTDPKNIIKNPASDRSPAWSPDSRMIAFVSDRSGGDEIYVVDADGANLGRLTQQGTCLSPAWSPDGRTLAFDLGMNTIIQTNPVLMTTMIRAIGVVDADGKNLRRFTDETAYNRDPRWSPNGRLIVFASTRDDPNPKGCGSNCNYEIYIMNADGTNPRRLTNNPASDSNPAWSP